MVLSVNVCGCPLGASNSTLAVRFCCRANVRETQILHFISEKNGYGGLWTRQSSEAVSPFVLRVRIALALKGIDYEFIEEKLLTQNKSQMLLQSNPIHKKISVFFHNGMPICESAIIVEYIEEAWATKELNLMPKHLYDRAIARFWAAFVDDKLVPCLIGVFRGQGQQQQKAVEESVGNFLLLEEALRTSSCFSGKAYFGGDKIGFVDIALGGMLEFIKAIEKATDTVLIDLEKMPLLTAWIDRFSAVYEVKEFMPRLIVLCSYSFFVSSQAFQRLPPLENEA